MNQKEKKKEKEWECTVSVWPSSGKRARVPAVDDGASRCVNLEGGGWGQRSKTWEGELEWDQSWSHNPACIWTDRETGEREWEGKRRERERERVR